MRKKAICKVGGLASAAALLVGTAQATTVSFAEFGLTVKAGPSQDIVYSYYEDGFGATETGSGVSFVPPVLFTEVDLGSSPFDLTGVISAVSALTDVTAFFYFNMDVCEAPGDCSLFDNELVELLTNPPGGLGEANGVEFGDTFFDDVFFNFSDAGAALDGTLNVLLGDDVAGAISINVGDLGAGMMASVALSIIDAPAGRARIGGGTPDNITYLVDQFNAGGAVPVPLPAALPMMALGLGALVGMRRRRA